MKHPKKTEKSFSEELKEKVRALKGMKPGLVHVFNINAEYGSYQIIMSEDSNIKEKMKNELEIKGKIHHLFLSEKGLQTTPTREQISNNLKGMLVLRGLDVHLRDPDGMGQHLAKSHDLNPNEVINLAGGKGEDLIKKSIEDEHFYEQAYRIIQKDILSTLEKVKEEKEYTFEEE